MKKVTLILGVHNHQPVGNFGSVFEELYAKAYEPFARALHRHPGVKFAFHTTGPLLEWLEAHRPDYFTLLKEMVKRGQVELFSGGMYEPILPILPDRDKAGQIQALNGYLKERFGVRARGMWVAERVWEPHLPKTLSEAGIEYTVMDDAHFKAAGFREEDTFGYYLTEEQGAILKVFPISEKMRYLVPFRAVEETLDYLRSVATEAGDRCVVLMDDGEKFGGWPDTFKWVYEDGWLENFLAALEKNADWITCSTFSGYLDSHPPLGRVYLPAASYTEMGEWALPADAARDFGNLRHELADKGELPRMERYLKGGFWRNFLTKYPEINHLHKKMLLVSRKVREAERKLGKKGTPRQKALLERAVKALYRGQCNCPYWHGVFGGLYLNHLRFGVYRELIEAEKLAESILSPKGGMEVLREDFNKDGHEDILVSTPEYHAILEPGLGGALTELDWLKTPINLSDVLTRRKEAYHEKLLQLAQGGSAGGGVASIHDQVKTKEPGLEKRLHYDWYRRASLIEHLVPVETPLEDMKTARFKEMGDFVGLPYQASLREGKKGGALTVELKREGHLWDRPEGSPLGLVKKVEFPAKGMEIKASFVLENRSDHPLYFRFLSEWNLTLLAGDSPDRNYYVKGRELASPRLNSTGEERNVEEAGMVDNWLKLRVALKAGKPARFWRYPVETVSQSEGGFEAVYQGSCLVFGWDVSLPVAGRFESSMAACFEELDA